jgi:hypothetical protein
VNVNRTKPKFGKPEPQESQTKSDDSMSCVLMPLVVILSYFVLSAIVRSTSGNGSKLDQTICYGALIVLGIVILLGVRAAAKESLAIEQKKKQWKIVSQSAQVVIVNRYGYPGGSYEDEYGIPHRNRPHYSLTLKLPDQIDVEIDVSESVYKKLENRNTVRIYYDPELPMTFMLEEEF